jgi:hypothetical protein
VSATDLATLVTAGFAAVAAIASWASVLQTRRERVAAQTPDVHIEVVQAIGANQRNVRVELVNAGGLAKAVKFAVLVDNQLATGHPPPIPTFKPGESRIIETGITPSLDAKRVAFVSYYDAGNTRFYVSYLDPAKKRVYRVKDLSAQRLSDNALLLQLAPGFDLGSTRLVTYDTTERNV